MLCKNHTIECFSRKEEMFNPTVKKVLTDSNKILRLPSTEKRERNNVVRSNGYCRINLLELGTIQKFDYQLSNPLSSGTLLIVGVQKYPNKNVPCYHYPNAFIITSKITVRNIHVPETVSTRTMQILYCLDIIPDVADECRDTDWFLRHTKYS